MPSARDAKDWAADGGLHGIGDSLYTPFSGTDGDDIERLMSEKGPWWTAYPGRPGYFTHWGEPFRYAASLLGLPTGDYPHSRPPQGILPAEGREEIRAAYENSGLVKVGSGA